MPFLPPNQQRQSTEGNCTRKVKPVWIILKQETVSGNSISKSAPLSRQITMPVTHYSVFYRPDAFLPPNQQRQSSEGMCLGMLIPTKSHSWVSMSRSQVSMKSRLRWLRSMLAHWPPAHLAVRVAGEWGNLVLQLHLYNLHIQERSSSADCGKVGLSSGGPHDCYNHENVEFVTAAATFSLFCNQPLEFPLIFDAKIDRIKHKPTDDKLLQNKSGHGSWYLNFERSCL